MKCLVCKQGFEMDYVENELVGVKKGLIKERVRYFFYSYLLHGLNFGKVLDVGCGNNFVLKEFAKVNGKHWVGVDRKKTGNKIVIGDAYNLPFNNNSFDLVFSHMLLEHLDKPMDFVKECSRVSNKYIVVITEKPSNHFWDALDHVRPYTKKSLERLLLVGGFRVVKLFDFPLISSIAVVGEKILD